MFVKPLHIHKTLNIMAVNIMGFTVYNYNYYNISIIQLQLKVV